MAIKVDVVCSKCGCKVHMCMICGENVCPNCNPEEHKHEPVSWSEGK